jgi:hypothetical protein
VTANPVHDGIGLGDDDLAFDFAVITEIGFDHGGVSEVRSGTLGGK